jgi:predicted SAM-dependent methyltransferase
MREFGTLELVDGVPPIDRDWLSDHQLRGLDCGCGRNPTAGWLNVDMRPFAGPDGSRTVPGRVALLDGTFYFLEQDVRETLPIDDASFDWIYSSHLIEHLRPEKVIEVLRQLRRLLKPGGLLRLSTPDLRRYIEGYVDPERRFFEEHRRRLSTIPVFADGVPDRPGWMINQVFYNWGHRWIYDLGEIRHVAEQAGFDAAAVEEASYREGREPALWALDPEGRDDVSLYVEIER